jgi:hypothetical protein
MFTGRLKTLQFQKRYDPMLNRRGVVSNRYGNQENIRGLHPLKMVKLLMRVMVGSIVRSSHARC